MGNMLVLPKKPDAVISTVDECMPEGELLKHYVSEGTKVLQGLDNLGNFLMGFGVLMLGYLLNSNMKFHFSILAGVEEKFVWSGVSVLAWVAAVVFLLGFMYLFIFELLAGRSIYAWRNDKKSIGSRIRIRKMSYEEFEKMAPTFKDFLRNNYLESDRTNSQQTWYATFRYCRYMAFKKLMIMNQMRCLLAWAMACGVIFKLVDIFVQAF